MRQIILGRTGLSVGASSFGALPIQRLSHKEAAYLVRLAYEKGMNFFDTANGYTDSEEKLGMALADVRDKVVIATKSTATDKKTLLGHIENSLKMLKTDYIDLIQLHNPKKLPDENDELYEGLLEAKKKGMVRFIGITNHSLDRAADAVRSGLYDTLQFPFSYLSGERDIELYNLTIEHNMGFIAMKAMSGGLITNARSAKAFFNKHDKAVPIWGIQRESELMDFINLENDPPMLTPELEAEIEREKKELSGSFCRACGYCLPCPAGIDIPMAARMKHLLRRMPYEQFLNEKTKEKMLKTKECLDCGHCKSKCPYSLDAAALMRENLPDYLEFYAEHVK